MILMGLLAPVALHLTPSHGSVKFLKVRNLGFKEFRKPCRMKQFRKIHNEQFLKFLRIFQWIIFAKGDLFYKFTKRFSHMKIKKALSLFHHKKYF